MNFVKHFILSILLIVTATMSGQEDVSYEKHGRTCNVSSGLGYYNYVGYAVPVIYADLELLIDKNITAAPFFAMYSYKQKYFWGDHTHTFRDYNYSETVTNLGIKISYYFDEILKINKKWDLYSAASLGMVMRQTNWESAYAGRNKIDPGFGALYLNLHIGAEYHVTRLVGLQLDASASMSTIGLAFHL